MSTITLTRVTGIMAIGMTGTGIRVSGSNGAELISYYRNSHETPTIFADPGRNFGGSILFYTY
jgi:hypothetical protein